MLCLDLGLGQGEQQPCQHVILHVIMENNSKILQSWTSRELIKIYLNVLGSGIGIVDKAGPFI